MAELNFRILTVFKQFFLNQTMVRGSQGTSPGKDPHDIKSGWERQTKRIAKLHLHKRNVDVGLKASFESRVAPAVCG